MATNTTTSDSKTTDEKSNIVSKISKEETIDCIICCEPTLFIALGKCNHTEACAVCFMRRKILCKDNQCPICKTPLESVILTNSFDKPFESYSLLSFDEDSTIELEMISNGQRQEFKVFLDGPKASEYFGKLEQLWQFDCPLCTQANDLPSLSELKKHLKSTHKLNYCDICLKDRKVFLREQKLYSDRDLTRHLRTGDGDTQIKHCECKFCVKYFYDSDQLYHHLHDSHFTCFLCDKLNVLYKYYENYESLKNHFCDDHFMCDDQECLEKKYIVFSTDSELKMHKLSAHAGSMSKHQRSRQTRELIIDSHSISAMEIASKEKVNALQSMFPHLNIHILRSALKKSNGDVESAANSLLENPSSKISYENSRNVPREVRPSVPRFTGPRTVLVVNAPNNRTSVRNDKEPSIGYV